MKNMNAVGADRLNYLSSIIFTAAIAVHKEMGPGLLESVYQHCLLKELRSLDFNVETSVMVELHYKGEILGKEYVIDVLVENEIILELKAIENILPVHEAQIISYLRLANKRMGFLINFNVPLMKQGFRRFVNNL